MVWWVLGIGLTCDGGAERSPHLLGLRKTAGSGGEADGSRDLRTSHQTGDLRTNLVSVLLPL